MNDNFGSTVNLKALEQLSLAADDVNDFSALAIKSLEHFLSIRTMLLFLPVNDETLEVKASFGKPYAELEEGRFLKRNRKTPVTDAMKFQSIQAWSSAERMHREYPDLFLWPKIMPAVVAIPIIKDGESVAGCVFIPSEEFPQSRNAEIIETLTVIAELIYQVYSNLNPKP